MVVDIVTCFESNEERVRFIYDACISKGYEVNVITSDFSHIRKEKRNSIPDGYNAVNTKPYNKNLSFERIISHIEFSRDAFKLVKKHNPDLIWVMAPANCLIKEAYDYKKNRSVKVIIDIIDMWPESLPTRFNKHLFPFNIWRNIRRKYINCADILVTECNFYKNVLNDEYKKEIKTIYWARDKKNTDKSLNLPENRLSLCYIGSINNIIDIDRIYELIYSCDMPVILYVIGEGEKTDFFIEKLSEICYVEYCGPIRDEKKKKDIFEKCHAGINIYKDNLYIGLTVKCIDYFEHGLPIINNIKGDTWMFVIQNKVGINVDDSTEIKSEELINMRMNNKNIYDLYNRNFTKEVFIENCLNIFDEVFR